MVFTSRSVQLVLSHITVHTHESTIYTVILHRMFNSSVCCEFVDSDDFVLYIVQEKIKYVPVKGSEGVEMEKHQAGSDGGEDPSSLQLTTADGECVLLYTVNTTYYCSQACGTDMTVPACGIDATV